MRYFCLKVCILNNVNSYPPLIILLSLFSEVAIYSPGMFISYNNDIKAICNIKHLSHLHGPTSKS